MCEKHYTIVKTCSNGFNDYAEVRNSLILRPFSLTTRKRSYSGEVGIRKMGMYLALARLVRISGRYESWSIHYEEVSNWEIEKTQLVDQALINMSECIPPRLFNTEYLENINFEKKGLFMPNELTHDETKDAARVYTSANCPAFGYVLTNTGWKNGAVSILYPGVMYRLGEMLGDYYIVFDGLNDVRIHSIKDNPNGLPKPFLLRHAAIERNLRRPFDERSLPKIYRYRTANGRIIEIKP
ncbi:MAG: DUF5688 family protein [Lachnospiraceae bacterium]|nr:DUF5688 family protein [Lachnospiraceae bacterium]